MPEQSELAEILNWIGTALNPGRPQREDDTEASEAAQEIANELADGVDGVGEEFVAATLAADGAAAVLERVDRDTLAEVAAEIVTQAGPDRAALQRLAAGLIRRGLSQAADAADVLAPGNALSTWLVAFHSSGSSAACIGALAAATSAASDGDGALERLAAGCGAAVVPAELSRTMALLHDGALRFGTAMAQALVRGHLIQRLLAPALESAGRPLAAAQLRQSPILEALAAFCDHIVVAGRDAEEIARSGEDPDDITVQRGQALQSEMYLHAAFADPTPHDPLGTLPATRVTALGQAILKGRSQRPGGYAWASVQRLEREDPDGFGRLLTDERIVVLDLAATAAGITLE